MYDRYVWGQFIEPHAYKNIGRKRKSKSEDGNDPKGRLKGWTETDPKSKGPTPLNDNFASTRSFDMKRTRFCKKKNITHKTQTSDLLDANSSPSHQSYQCW